MNKIKKYMKLKYLDWVRSKKIETVEMNGKLKRLIENSIDMGASDIHFDPNKKSVKGRVRIDGILYPLKRDLSIEDYNGFCYNMRDLSQLPTTKDWIDKSKTTGIVESVISNDGGIRIEYKGRNIGVRLAFAPTVNGDATSIRLLDPKNILGLDYLGFSKNDLKRYKEIISTPESLVLLTGPTGIGKTTTIYATLMHMNPNKRTIFSVEDPVEYGIAGVNQINVSERAGKTFPAVLRGLLRSDADVIYLGEMRDYETADSTIKGALTGHQVISTLHTKGAPETVARMINMGIEPFLVASTVSGIVSQRLVRKLCDCKIPYRYKPGKEKDPNEIKFLESYKIDPHSDYTFKRNPKGCKKCRGVGYRGRTGVFEVMEVNDSVKEMIMRGYGIDEMRGKIVEDGQTRNFLGEEALEKVKSGITDINEVFRIFGNYDTMGWPENYRIKTKYSRY